MRAVLGDRRGGGDADVHGAGGGADGADGGRSEARGAGGRRPGSVSRCRWSSSARRLLRAREGDGQGQAGQERRDVGGARPRRQLQLRARPARHRARQVLPPQRVRLPVLERDAAPGPTATPCPTSTRWATGSTATSGTARALVVRQDAAADARRVQIGRRVSRVRGNHNGGPIRSGPDGKIYLIAGDTGRRGQTQNLVDGPFVYPLPATPTTTSSATTSSAARTPTPSTSRA